MKYSFLLCLFSFITFSLSAQGTFTDKLRQNESGSGKVIIEQAYDIERVVNNISSVKSQTIAEPVKDVVEEEKHDESQNVVPSHVTSNHNAANSHSYVARGRHKAAGYRICIFMGGNSRNDKNRAIQIGEKCRSKFRELSVYTRFMAPRWVTHVGDFRTRNEAQKYVELIRKANFTYIVRVVRSEVNLPNR